MRKNILALIMVTGLLLTVTGCGQKGPLYMPSEPETTDPQTPPQEPATINQNVVDESVVDENG